MTELGKWPITLLQVTFFCGTHRPHSEKRLSKPSAAISSEAAAKCPSPPPKKTNIPTTCDLKHKTLRPNVDAIWPHDRINQCLFSARFSRGSLRGARALRSMPDADWGRWVKTAPGRDRWAPSSIWCPSTELNSHGHHHARPPDLKGAKGTTW